MVAYYHVILRSIVIFCHDVFKIFSCRTLDVFHGECSGRLVCTYCAVQSCSALFAELPMILVIKTPFTFQPMPRQGGSVVSMSDPLPGGCKFDPQLRRLFFPAYFHLSPLQKHVKKVVGGFEKKSCVNTGVRKPGNTYASLTAMI